MSGHLYRAAHKRQRQDQIKSLLSSNQHTVIQMNSKEFVDYAISVKMKSGMSRAEAVDWIDKLLEEHNSAPQVWKRNKDALKTFSGLLPLMDDMKALGVLALEMQRQGNVFGKYRIAAYSGSVAVMFTSYPRLNAHLAGTQYLANNARVFTVGVGKLSANNAMKGGFVLTLLISVTFHAVDQMLDDTKTWHDLVAGIAVDMAVVGAAIVSTSLIMSAIGSAGGAAATAIAGAAVAPLVIVVLVGAFFAYVFSDTSEYTLLISNKLREIEDDLNNGVITINRKIRKFEESMNNDPYGTMGKMFGIPVFQKGSSRIK